MIGVIGLGKMGRAIAGRLEAVGETIVVWNRTAGRADGLVANVLPTPSALCERSDLILSVLSDNAAIDAVYCGEDGVLSADLTGKTVVEICTMSPNKVRELESRVAGAGGAFLECPVGGTIGPAEKGALLGLAGGQAAAFEAARPTLEKLTRRLEHVGPVGSGSAMKLAINLRSWCIGAPWARLWRLPWRKVWTQRLRSTFWPTAPARSGRPRRACHPFSRWSSMAIRAA